MEARVVYDEQEKLGKRTHCIEGFSNGISSYEIQLKLFASHSIALKLSIECTVKHDNG